MKEANESLNEADKIISFLSEVIKENDAFLRENAREVYEEVTKLAANDAINVLYLIFENFENEEEAINHPIVFFAMHVLLPMSYAIYTDLLLGNLPACFMELRLMLETMAKCYFTEKIDQSQESFVIKLELLEDMLKEKKISITKLMKELGPDFVKLWGKLSEKWIHTRGILTRITDRFVETGIPPSWGLILPATYTEEDLDDIQELGKRLAEFRKLLKAVVDELFPTSTAEPEGEKSNNIVEEE